MPDSTLPLPSGATASSVVSDAIERRNESRRWKDENYREEWVEAWRSIKCRTRPIMKLDAEGRPTKEEDKSRTNVEGGLANLIYRKNVARLAKPYSLKVLGGSDPSIGPRLTALLSQQYDRSGEHAEDVRVRSSAEALGIGISLVYWDYVYREMNFRRLAQKDDQFYFPNRTAMMQYQGAPQDEITQAVSQNSDVLSDEETSAFVAKSGNLVKQPQRVVKYEGPCVKFCFPGDVDWEPHVRSLSDSFFVSYSCQESDLWLKEKALKLDYPDPDTGESVKAFDPKAVAALLALQPSKRGMRSEMQELKDAFRQVTGKSPESSLEFPARLRTRKMFDIIQEHAQDEAGRMWITWISEDYKELPLGRMPYPCDFYGQSAFTEEVPLPDLIDSIGDSTPRLMRFLFSLFNSGMAQNWDGVTAGIRKLIMLKENINISPETLQLGNFLVSRISDLNGIKEFDLKGLPAGAFERMGSLLQLMGMFEPSMVGTATGGDANPLAGKLATTALLNAKAADSLLDFKIDGRNFYLYWLGMKKLWLNQQLPELGKPWEVQAKYFGQGMQDTLKGYGENQKPEWAISERMGGKTVAIRLDPEEIQEDLDIEPEAGSYMAVNDEIKRQAAVELGQVAMAAPQIIDARKVLRFHLSTIPGIGNPDDYILPETGPQPPQPKLNLNLTGKMEDLPELTNQILGSMGMQPTEENTEQAQVDTVRRISEAADHADNLLSPSTGIQHQQAQEKDLRDAESKSKPKPKAKPKPKG